MPYTIPIDVFIKTLTKMLHHDRECRAADLSRTSKDQTRRFLRSQADRTGPRIQTGASSLTDKAEAPDCVSFFSNTINGATQ
jgi:hypothetical protein